jgi:hypothetical protein
MANTTQQQTQLTMLTASETQTLSRAAQQDISTQEDLIYKYRDEFLYIQRAAEQGLTQVDTLIDDPNELAILARSWGFTCTVQDKFSAKIVYRKNLGEEEVIKKLSNISIDWSRPGTPTVDVAYYRQTGNLVSLLDSTLFVPKLTQVKQQLGVTGTTYTVDKRLVG